MAMMGKIRRMYFRDKLSVSEIARRTSLARNTIKKWLRAPRGVEPRYRRGAKPGKLTPFQAQLIQALEADAHRPKRERRTALVLKARLAEQGVYADLHVGVVTSDYGAGRGLVVDDPCPSCAGSGRAASARAISTRRRWPKARFRARS